MRHTVARALSRWGLPAGASGVVGKRKLGLEKAAL